MIAGLDRHFSASDGPLSREPDPFFRSQFLKPPIRIGRTEHLAGFGLAVWGFKADAQACLWGRMGTPGRPGEPQSANGEHRRYGQGQLFCFHWLSLLDSSFTFATPLCGEFCDLALHLE